LASLAVRYSEFQRLNAEILAISVDSVYSHKIWNEIELSNMAGVGMPFPMLTDENGSIGRAYDVYDEQHGKDLRGTFIIDPNGLIHGMELLAAYIGRSSEEILRQLQAFQNYTLSGELAPADWHPGEKTIIEAIEKSGQIWKEWKPKKENPT
jgi:peroxiredoxin (alkyl hydroperoxide reductase subunit C)